MSLNEAKMDSLGDKIDSQTEQAVQKEKDSKKDKKEKSTKEKK